MNEQLSLGDVADPDAVTLVCQSCGEQFAGNDGWQPLCWRCWRSIRDGHGPRSTPPAPTAHREVFRKGRA
jgi:hypothetical protein